MGTAGVMLAAALSLFAFVGTLVSFGAWPGLSAHEGVDAVLVESVSRPAAEPIRIGERPPEAARSGSRAVSGGTAVAGVTPAGGGTPTAPAPRTPSGAAPAPAPAPAPAGGGPVEQVAEQPAARDVIERTTGDVQRTVETVTEQVGEIVGQVGGQVDTTVQDVDRAGDRLLP